MLAGFAQVPDANWAVVAQQPRDLSLAPLGQLMRDMVLGMIPAGLLGLGLADERLYLAKQSGRNRVMA